ncbi:MAG: hypothetical protein QY325_00125 [Flavobacteriales bacterium]|jgi:hypothetical protein|nr:MAG: hypothetical protein QY325_00125 [Flavobacteriales bacterium]
MPIAEASFTGTIRTIAVLLLILWLVRLIMRRSAAARPAPGPGPHRPPGHVRVEEAPRAGDGSPAPRGTIIDADFEEIK